MMADRKEKTWKAPAKINLFLHITGRREDGYHELQTVFQFLDFADQLQFNPRADDKIIYHYQHQGNCFENDLIVRAVILLQQYADERELPIGGLDIYLKKLLPMGGGLGGGSSDAATTLVAINKLWQLGLSQIQLAQLGLRLGADVPVFVHGNAVWAEGVGEKFTPIELAQPWYLVVVPPVHVSTSELFKHPNLARKMPLMKVDDYVKDCGINVFEKLARQMYPEIDKAIGWLRQYAPARMTGSGACVFAAFATEQEALKVVENMPEDLSGFVAKGRNRSPLYEN